MKLKVLTLVVSKKRVKIHESILSIEQEDENTYARISARLRLSLGIIDAALICYAEGKPEFFVSKGRGFDENFVYPFMEFFNETMLSCNYDYHKIKKNVTAHIKNSFANSEKALIFNLCPN